MGTPFTTDESSTRPSGGYEFGPFRLEIDRRQLKRGEVLLEIAPKVFDLLSELVAARGDVVRKEDLLKRVWPDVTVEEGILAVTVHGLRRVLRGAGDDEEYIGTISRVGYRIAVPVRALNSNREAGGENSLAIMPFEPLSDDPETRLLSAGLVEGVISRLTNVGGLVVVPWHTVTEMPESGPAELSNVVGSLRVDFVLRGSIQRSGERFRVSVQLVRGPRGSSVWGHQFDVSGNDPLRLQDQIIELLIENLQLKLGADVQFRVMKQATNNVEAYELYWNALTIFSSNNETNLWKAIAYLRESIEADPSFALPYAALGETYLLLSTLGYGDRAELVGKAERASRRALALDVELADGHLLAAFLDHYHNVKFQDARAHYERALTLKPGFAKGRYWYGMFLVNMGEYEAGLREVDSAIKRFFEEKSSRYLVGFAYYQARRFGRAKEEARRWLMVHPAQWSCKLTLSLSCTELGDTHEAERWARAAVRDSQSHPRALGALAYAMARAGNEDVAVNMIEATTLVPGVDTAHACAVYGVLGDLERAVDLAWELMRTKDPVAAALGVDPRFDSLRRHHRFQELLRTMRFPQWVVEGAITLRD